MTRRLHLVRHGPTHAKVMVGWSDLPADLSDQDAIDKLSQHLPKDAVFVSSDLDRAVRTADAISDGRERLPHEQGLREIHFGDWELRSWKDIDDEDPSHIRAFWERPGDVAAPNGESWNMLRNRCDNAIEALLQQHAAKDLVVVCHFGAILTQIQKAKQLSSTAAFGHKIDNLSVTEITIRENKWSVSRLNYLV